MAEPFDPAPLLGAVPRLGCGWSADVSLDDGRWKAATAMTSHPRFERLSAHERLETSSCVAEAMARLAAECEALLPAAAFSDGTFPSFHLHFFTSHPGHDGTDAAEPAKVSLTLNFPPLSPKGTGWA